MVVDFYKKHLNVIFLCLGIVVMSSVLVANFLALPNNLIFSDEGWYLCLLRDLPHSCGTKFHLLFQNVFRNNVYLIRLCCWFMQILGGIMLVVGFNSYLKLNVSGYGKCAIILLMLCSLYWSGNMQDCPSFNYNNLKVFYAELGVGFFLLGLSKGRMIFMMLAGFFMAFLFPVMITNIVLIPFVFLALLLLSGQKLRDGFGFMVGICLFAVYYFVFIESPQEMVSSVLHESRNVVNRGGEQYGMVFLFEWIWAALLFLLKCAFSAIVVFCIYYVANRYMRKGTLKWVMVGVISICVLWCIWRYMNPVTKVKGGKWLVDFRWTFLFLLFLSMLVEKKPLEKKEIVIGVLLSLSTVCLSFGSNVPFCRHGEVIPFLNLIMLYFTFKQSYKWKTALLCIVFLSFFFFLSKLPASNWHGEKWFGDHVDVNTIDIPQHIKLESKYIDMLISCREKVPQGRVLNSYENWGQVALLGYTPISYDFASPRNGMEWFQKTVDEEIKKEGHLWVLSNVWMKEFNDNMELLVGYDMQIDTMYDNIYYYVYPCYDTNNQCDE